jgi:succinate dehydrogenase/fumarate reductase flavoprotein subunit
VFSADRIDSVTVIEHVETANFAIVPMERIPAQIVEFQSLDIDMVAGATLTSMAIIAAVTDTVQQADGDAVALRQGRGRPAPNAPTTLDAGVLVVGSGISGLSAAIEAAYAGADVLVIDKLGLFGGVTSTSAGIIQGADNVVLRATGVTDDTAEAFEAFIHEMGHGRLDRDIIRNVAATGSETISWLADMGVEWSPRPHISFDRFDPFRGVEPYGPGTVLGAGAQITMRMVDYAQNLGVRFMMETTAEALILDGDTVVGVNATDITGGEITILADSVVLATGGFQSNPELMERYLPLVAPFFAFNINFARGDGLLMGIEAGAATYMRDTAIGSITAPNRGVFVTPSGERFNEESDYGLRRTNELVERGYSFHFAIMDSSHLNEALEAALADGRAFEAETLAELAELVGMEPAVLEATISRYNELVARGEDIDFGKPAEFLQAIEEGPFYAQSFGGFTIFGTMGGLLVDFYGRVISTDGDPIPGLFAAGEVANGTFMPRDYGGSGMALNIYGNMARVVGRAAAGIME